MWQTKALSEAVEINHQNEYSPPEKKSKDFADSNPLKTALECCRNQEIGIEEASLIYGIPKSTLRAKLNDINCSAIDENYRVFVLSIYPPEAELNLVNCLQDCIASQITMTITDIRRLAYDLVCEKYKVTSLPREKNCLLGQRWYRQFIEKYPHLDFSNHHLIGDEEKSVNFYNSFETLLNKFNIESNQIYAVDGVDLKFRASCADDMKVFHKRRTMYTNAKAVCCINPVGDFIPPVFLNLQNASHLNLKSSEPPKFNLNVCDESFQKTLQFNKVSCKLKEIGGLKSNNIPTSEDLLNIEKQIKMHLNKKLQPMTEKREEELREKLYDQFVQLKNKLNTKCESSPNEITPEIFYDWFLGFLTHVKPNSQQPVLLLLSDQNYVKSFKILELGKRNNVKFLVLPPHSIHKIYPLDGFAMSLNRNLSTCARRWLGKNPDFKVQQVPLHVIFMEAFNETMNPLIAKNGFVYSGIWPINRNIFQSSELGGESILLLNKQKLGVESCTFNTTGVKRNNSSFGQLNEAELKKLCRLCLKEKMYMKPLLETVPSPGPNYHGKKIYEITKLSITYGDGLPPSICQYCLVQLMDAVKIKDAAVNSHKKQLKLREALNRFYFEDEESESQELMYLFDMSIGSPRLSDSRIMSRLMAKNFDMNSICRICMGEKPLMTSIFFRSQDGTVMCSDTCTRIVEISHCQVHIHDGLSSSICPFCRASIHKASDFIRRALNSDKILREIISNFRAKN